jgi:SAM-dependent methyltransferase
MKFLKMIRIKIISKFRSQIISYRIKKYLNKGMIAWSPGYYEYKNMQISMTINNDSLVKDFNNSIPKGFGLRLDDRIVEYPWILSNLTDKGGLLLDAGSTLNFEYIVNHPVIVRKQLSIFTFYPENNNYSYKRISYIYGDLRNMPFKDSLFDEIVCQSTLEHIDMDNSIYGYQIDNNSSQKEKSYEFVKVVKEFYKVLKSKGLLLITVPYGKYENHGFFQQFDSEMKNRIIEIIKPFGKTEEFYYKYLSDGWIKSFENECQEMKSYNPHTGEGKGNDGAAHSRAICCIKFTKE